MTEKKYQDKLKDLLDITTGFSKAEKKLVTDAFFFAQFAHEGQERKSGEPYFFHLIETAKNLARLKMDATVIAAGILHDSIEDGVATEDELRTTFGEEILFLVDGVTKLGHVKYRGMRRHNESLRKLFISTSKDVRVLIIKFADRLHNMQTLEHVRPDKRVRIATETLEIYVPLAYRLGISTLSKELGDLSFKYVYPDDYERVREIVKRRAKQSMQKLEHVERSIIKKIAETGMRDFHSSYRIKGLYSLYRKLQRKDWDIERVYDIAALRIMVNDIAECYQVLGTLHQNYRPMPGRIKDFIAFPKPNGYQSIHTTLFTGDGGLVEVQIRTKQMHQQAEFGAASHVAYKTGRTSTSLKNTTKDHSWIQWLLPGKQRPIAEPDYSPEWLNELADHSDNPESRWFEPRLKKDFFSDRIFAFTPVGDVIDLPAGSTPIDFAYQVHTEVGEHVSGVKIGGKMASISTTLKNGDIVEIITSKKAEPKQKWMQIARTNDAKRKIRAFLHKDK
jgi:GTP pyrophosphokinase